MAETEAIPIGALLSHTVGGGWGFDDYEEGLLPVRIIRGADFPTITLRRLETAPLRYEPPSKVESRQLRVDDIVIEISGGTKDRPTGRTVLITGDLLEQAQAPVIPASFCRLLRVDPAKANGRFIYYLLQEAYARGGTWEYQNQSTGLSNFQFELFRTNFMVNVPSLAEQRAIADVLTALDDKIAANTQLTKTATALSAALFSSMNETEPMPLTKVADFVNGRAFTKDASGTGRVVVRIAELNSGIGGSTVFSDAEVPDKHVARPGDILFAWSGSLTLHRWFRSEAIVNQHIFKVIPRANYPHWLVWGLLVNKLDEFKSIAADKATTMGHIQRRHLEEPVAVPVPALVARHNDAMTALWDRALAAEVESLTLAATRDALLPALLSGRLRVRDAASGIPQSPR